MSIDENGAKVESFTCSKIPKGGNVKHPIEIKFDVPHIIAFIDVNNDIRDCNVKFISIINHAK